jgi:hypothetical protein
LKFSYSIVELRLGLRNRALLGLHVGLEGPALKFIEKIAAFYIGAFRKQPFVHEGCHARHHVHELGA